MLRPTSRVSRRPPKNGTAIAAHPIGTAIASMSCMPRRRASRPAVANNRGFGAGASGVSADSPSASRIAPSSTRARPGARSRKKTRSAIVPPATANTAPMPAPNIASTTNVSTAPSYQCEGPGTGADGGRSRSATSPVWSSPAVRSSAPGTAKSPGFHISRDARDSLTRASMMVAAS